MHLRWLILSVVLCVIDTTSGISNDIVATLRCRLLCRKANGYASEVRDDMCTCSVLNELGDEQKRQIEEVAAAHHMPVVFKRAQRNHKVKRQLDDNLLEDWRAKLDEQWAETAENLRAWREAQIKENPLFGDLEEQAENLKAWHEQQARSNPLISGLEEQAENWKTWQRQISETPLFEDLEEHAENLQAWHNDNLEQLQEGLQEQHEKMGENLEKLKDLHDGKVLGEHAQQVKEFHDDHIKPLLEQSQFAQPDKLSWLHGERTEPVLGQMAPFLDNYESHSTGIGGSNVNFPRPNHPNPFVPPLAHIISALPIPRFNLPAIGAPAAPDGLTTSMAGPLPGLGGRLIPPKMFSRSNAGPLLPAQFAGPYNPKNPILVQPIIAPPSGKPQPILSSLQKNVDDMLANMKRNGGRLMPENYMNSDALSNSESQVNQINVNVRVEPTPTPPNLFSFLVPDLNRDFLAAPRPKNGAENHDGVTDNPGLMGDDDLDTNKGASDMEEEEEEEEEDVEEEQRMRKNLLDADRSKFNAHVVDSVKKNLSNKQGSKDESKSGKSSNGMIVTPEEFMQDTEEDLDTLVK